MFFIVTPHFPVKGYKAITLWPFIFSRKALSGADRRHELIHASQYRETLVIGFYLLWLFLAVREFVLCLFNSARNTRADGRKRSIWTRTYYGIPLEREAYDNESDENYLTQRRHYAWINYL